MLRLANHSLLAHRDALGVAGTPGCGRNARTASAATIRFVALQP